MERFWLYFHSVVRDWMSHPGQFELSVLNLECQDLFMKFSQKISTSKMFEKRRDQHHVAVFFLALEMTFTHFYPCTLDTLIQTFFFLCARILFP